MSGGVIEESFLETPTSILAVVFLCLQAMSIIFQFIVNSLKRLLRSRNRLGMITALDHSVWELTLVGFISLCLIALQSQITSICVTASPARSSWSIIQRMYSTNTCNCCLQETQYTQQCILEFSSCGNQLDPFCNCNNQNATCVQPYTVETVEITDTLTGEQATAVENGIPATTAAGITSPSAEGLRRLLAGSGGGASISGGSTSATLEQYCLEDVTVPSSSCPPGQMPVVSFLALEQVHLLIFTIAVVHVFLGFLLYLAASARLWLQWSRWNIRDDPHTILVRDKLEEYYTSLDNNTDFKDMMVRRGNGTNNGGQTDGITAAAASDLPRSPFATSTLNRPITKERRSSSSKFASVAAAVLEAAGIDLEAGRQDPRVASSNAASFKQTATASEEGGTDGTAPPPLVLPSLNECAKKKESHSRYSLIRRNLSSPSTNGSSPLPDILVQEKDATTNRFDCFASGGGAPNSGSKNRCNNIFIRIWEYSTCFFFGLSPIGVIDHETYSIMRASYIYTHKLSTQFAFLDHVQRNLEDDLSHIVGLSVEFWIIIVLFILSSGPFGYAVTPFMSAVALILCLTNAKLVEITRKVTRRGGIGRLTSSIFWFNRPQLLLIPIKLVLFFCAFIYASFIFFAWQFGSSSCPFNDGFYTGWVLPWYTILIVNTLIFFHMAIVTLPTYSLCVLMGSDVKAHMLPRKFAKKLLAVATAAKEKLKAEKAAAAAAMATGSGGSGNINQGDFSSTLTVGVTQQGQGISDTSEISKEEEENRHLGITPAAATGLEACPSSPTAARSNHSNVIDLAPTRNAPAGVVIKESRLDKVVSLMSRRLVGGKDHGHDGGQ